VPCMTLRKNTERPVTITQGTNRLVELTKEGIVGAYRRLTEELKKGYRPAKVPQLWDGKAAERIVKIIAEHAERQASPSS